jgi:divalent metal cation (Fe/Co/Zn/Cd) transporter
MILQAIAQVQSRRWIGRSLGWGALWLMVMFLAIKLWLGGAMGSLSLMAGALLTLITCFSLLLNLFSWVSPQSAHQAAFGHSRSESGLILILIGGIGATSFNLLSRAGQQLFGGAGNPAIAATVPLTLPLFQLLVSITVISLILGITGYYQAKVLHTSLLRSSFRQCLVDGGVMVVILLELMGRKLGMFWLDPVLAAVIVIMALVAGWQLLDRQVPSLLHSMAIAPEALTATVCRVEGVLHCTPMQIRGLVGRLVYIEMQLTLHPECMTVADTIAARVERLLHQQYGPVQVTLYLESK